MSAPLSPAISVLRPVTRRAWRDYRLIALDMDSTLLRIETLDVLAAAQDMQAQMAAMTEAAMQGQVADYASDLQRRVALLRGLRAEHLDLIQVQQQLSDGAQRLMAYCRQRDMHCMVISSGFTYYAEQIRQHLDMQAVRANVLEIVDDTITGALLPQPGERFVDREEKKNALLHACAQLGIAPEQSIAVGDGANDAAMLAAAGLGVGFHPKSVLRAHADIAIEAGGLDALLYFLHAD